jgi:hypothetical protein
MDPVTLIVTALAAGAASALQDGVKDTVKDGYRRLRDSVKKRLAGHPDGQLALERYEGAPQKWESVLKDELTAAGAGTDAVLVAEVQTFLKLVDEAGSRSGKYNVSVHGGRGVQIGDHNVQTNTFGSI